VVKAGDIVKVKVLEVDVARKRIALTRRLDDSAPAPRGPREDRDARPNQNRGGGRDGGRGAPMPKQAPAPANNALAAAFARAKKS
jgi:uncharacterized protein